MGLNALLPCIYCYIVYTLPIFAVSLDTLCVPGGLVFQCQTFGASHQLQPSLFDISAKEEKQLTLIKTKTKHVATVTTEVFTVKYLSLPLGALSLPSCSQGSNC